MYVLNKIFGIQYLSHLDIFRIVTVDRTVCDFLTVLINATARALHERGYVHSSPSNTPAVLHIYSFRRFFRVIAREGWDHVKLIFAQPTESRQITYALTVSGAISRQTRQRPNNTNRKKHVITIYRVFPYN